MADSARVWPAMLRDAPWITGERARAYAFGLIGAYLTLAIIGVLQGIWLIQQDGDFVEGDFIAFWSAGRMAMNGQAAAAYDWAAHHAVQVVAVGHEFEGFFAWHNPPGFFFLAVPFALPPYVPAWLLFVAVTGALYVVGFVRVLPVRGAWMLALAAPASFLCMLAGQLGFLIAALMAAWLVLLDRRPVLAGAALGLLTIKPQFGLLFPLLLIGTGRWRVFFAAAATTLLLALAAGLVFGWESWSAFIASFTGETVGLLRRGGSDWAKLQSLYASFQRITGIEGLAMALHGICALAIAGAVLWLWRLPTSIGVRGASAIAGGFLITPYAYVYDATVVVLAAAFLAREALARGALPWERLGLVVAAALPVTNFVVGSFATPAAMLLILVLAIRRARLAG